MIDTTSKGRKCNHFGPWGLGKTEHMHTPSTSALPGLARSQRGSQKTLDRSQQSVAVIDSLLPSPGGNCGGRCHDHGPVLESIALQVSTGCPSRDVRREIGPWRTLRNRHNAQAADGTWQWLLAALQGLADHHGERLERPGGMVRGQPPTDAGGRAAMGVVILTRMSAVTRELLVFVASPGDCEDERVVVRDTAESVNYAISEQLGIRLRVEGWETVAPDFGRPQDRINPLVDKCDVFVGLLGDRWGSSTGSHTSGFQEEFERAVERRTSYDVPHVAIFFRHQLPQMLADPGPELEKVLDFKRRIEQEHVLLYGSFSDSSDLERQLWRLFTRLLTDAAAPSQLNATERSSAGAAPPGEGTVGDFDGSELDEARAQIAVTTDIVTQLARGTPTGVLDSDRFLLIALGLNNDGGFIPTHVANRLYARRHELALSIVEHEIWLRSLLADVGSSTDRNMRIVPGWGILSIGEEELLELLEDQDETVIKGVFSTLGRLSLRPAKLWGDDDNDVAVCATRWEFGLQRFGTLRVVEAYLADQASEGDIPLLEHLAAASQSDGVRQLRNALSGDPAAMAEAVASRSLEPAWKTVVLTSRLSSAADEIVRTLAIGKNTPETLRRLAANELHARGLVTDAMLRSLISFASLVEDVFRWVEDDASPVTAERVGQAVTGLEDVPHRLEYRQRTEAGTRSVDELLTRLEAGDDAAGAWEALGWKADPRLIERAREVFDTDGEAVVSELRSYLERDQRFDLIEFVHANARKAALRILVSQNPIPSADRARLWKELDRGSLYTKQECLMWLANGAISDDAEGLLAHLSEAYTETASVVVSAILRIGSRDHVRQLLQAGDDAHVVRAVRALGEDPAAPIAELRKYLHSPNAAARMAALEQIMEQSSEAELNRLLEEYQREESYYYNVVCELDWQLFAFKNGSGQECER